MRFVCLATVVLFFIGKIYGSWIPENSCPNFDTLRELLPTERFLINTYRKLVKAGVSVKKGSFTKIDLSPFLGKSVKIEDLIQQEASKWEERLWDEWENHYDGVKFSLDIGLMINMTASGFIHSIQSNALSILKSSKWSDNSSFSCF